MPELSPHATRPLARRPVARAAVFGVVLALGTLALPPGTAAAQQRDSAATPRPADSTSAVQPPTDPRLVPGARVRITLSTLRNWRIAGDIDSVLARGFVVDTGEHEDFLFIARGPELLPEYRTVRVRYDDIGQLELSRGRNRWKGAALWGLVGAGIGGALTGLNNAPEVNPTSGDIARAAVSGAIVGGIIGGTIGYFTGREQWERLPWP
ncbi:MAG TPA: hypothetical protein VFS08_16740 [Gemmatimonadaceae bacterium]|nr:hypothetical protein [Gemmatimonadaceae bacterium]